MTGQGLLGVSLQEFNISSHVVDKLRCVMDKHWFAIVTPAGIYPLDAEELIEFCANMRKGSGNECFPEAQKKAEVILKEAQPWLPDAY